MTCRCIRTRAQVQEQAGFGAELRVPKRPSRDVHCHSGDQWNLAFYNIHPLEPATCQVERRWDPGKLFLSTHALVLSSTIQSICVQLLCGMNEPDFRIWQTRRTHKMLFVLSVSSQHRKHRQIYPLNDVLAASANRD